MIKRLYETHLYVEHIALIFLLCIVVVSCNRDNSGEVLRLNTSLEWVPSAYQDNLNAVFINSSNETISLTTFFSIETDTRELSEDRTIQVEMASTQIVNIEKDISIAVSPIIFLNSEGEIARESILYSLNPLSVRNLDMEYWIDREAVISVAGTRTDMLDNTNIIGKAFSNVIKVESDEFPNYTELYANQDLGVIAFRDKDNILWRFERFE